MSKLQINNTGAGKMIRTKNRKNRSELIPALPIAWGFIYHDEVDDSPEVINDPWELWGVLTDLQRDFRSRIELHFEDVDNAFVLKIVHNPISIQDAYLSGMEKGKQIASRHSNRIGFVEEDEDGLLWYSMRL